VISTNAVHLASRAHPDDAEREHKAQEHQTRCVPMPVTATAHQITAARTAVDGDEDFSSVISEMEDLASIRRNP
jgi:hypothetical protein